MITIHLVFIVLAAICFLLAALQVPTPRFSMQAAGLLFLSLHFMVP